MMTTAKMQFFIEFKKEVVLICDIFNRLFILFLDLILKN